jgi:predicted permease
MLTRLRSILRALTQRDRLRHDLDEEMDFHVEQLSDDLMRQGMKPEEARREARRRFGNPEHVHDRTRQEMDVALFDEAGRNLRFALRGMRRSPVLTGAFVLTLALCIGFGTAVFSAVDAVLWKPLPYPAAERLALAGLHDPDQGNLTGRVGIDGASWLRIRDEAEGFQPAVFSGWVQGVNLSASGAARFVMQQRIGAGYFSTLGVEPLMGREFTVQEDVPDGPPLVILSHELWSGTFDADPEILGQTVRLKGRPHTVIGVMAADFRSDESVDVWTPIQASTAGEGSGTNYTAIVRLPTGMSWEEAAARFAAIAPPGGVSAAMRFGVVPLEAAMSAGYRLPLLILLGAVGLMILVGCANLAGIQVSRALEREGEMSTRQALGSGTGALVRQLIAENVVLGAFGGLLGLVVAVLTVDGLAVLFRTNLGVMTPMAVDGRALGVAMGLTGLATVLFGLAPLVRVSRTDAPRLLITGSRGFTGGGSRLLRKALLVGEVAMVTVLLFAAVLLARSYGHLASLEPGFDASGVWTAQLSLDDARFADADAATRLFEETVRDLREIQGVRGAAVALSLPYERPLNMPFRLEGDDPDGRPRLANLVYVTPGFFETLRIPVEAGRVLDEHDGVGSAAVAVISEGLATAHFPDGSAIGSRLTMGGAEGIEVVGIVGDVQQAGAGWGSSQPVWAAPTVYVPATQVTGPVLQQVHVWFSPSWIVRADAPSPELVASIGRVFESFDAELPIARTSSLEDVITRAFGQTRFQAVFLLTVAGFALLLACVGLYGIVAHEVQQGRREMGIRMALGVTPGRAVVVTGMAGVRLALWGLVAGGFGAIAAGRVLASLVWGVSPNDPVTLLFLVGAIGGLALIASFVPAARMGRLDPAAVLKE